MKSSPRTVLDTNVLVSAALSEHGKPRKALTLVTSRGLLLMSESTRDELARTLAKPKLQRYIAAGGRRRYLDWIAANSLLVSVTE